VNGGFGSPSTGNVQPTKQSNPTIPSNMTGINMINDVLIIPPALPTPMTCWISPIHHQYYLVSGTFEIRESERIEAISILKGHIGV
jgi:hypothetical protein